MPHNYCSDSGNLPTTQPVMQLRSDSICIYDEYLFPRNKSGNYDRKANFKEAKTYQGGLSIHAKKRIERAIDVLLMTTPTKRIFNPVIGKKVQHRISFVTLTVSDNTKNVTAKDAYKSCVKPFLQWLQKTKKVDKYIWKAELQERGQIHYHITSDAWIHYKEIREKWNYLQKKAGYLDDFYNRYGHYDPNSTDIHEVYKIRSLSSYLKKYISKITQNDVKTKGKIWDCSEKLKGVKYPVFQLTEENEKRIVEALQEDSARGIYGEQWAIIQGKRKKVSEFLTNGQKYELVKWIDGFSTVE